MMKRTDDISAPGMIDPPGSRVGRALVGAAEAGRADAAADRARKQARLKPAVAEAIRLAREAEGDLKMARVEHAQACAALVLGETDEAEVEALEREMADAEARQRRYELAAREIEMRLGVIRDPSGHILRHHG